MTTITLNADRVNDWLLEMGYSGHGFYDPQSSDSFANSALNPIASTLVSDLIPKEHLELICRHKWAEVLKLLMERAKSRGNINEIRSHLETFLKYGRSLFPEDYKDLCSEFGKIPNTLNPISEEIEILTLELNRKREALNERKLEYAEKIKSLKEQNARVDYLKSLAHSKTVKSKLKKTAFEELFKKMAVFSDINDRLKDIIPKKSLEDTMPEIGSLCSKLEHMENGLNEEEANYVTESLDNVEKSFKPNSLLRDLSAIVESSAQRLRAFAENSNRADSQKERDLQHISVKPLRIEKVLENMRDRHLESFARGEDHLKQLNSSGGNFNDNSCIGLELEMLEMVLAEMNSKNIQLLEAKNVTKGKIERINSYQELLSEKQECLKDLINQSQYISNAVQRKGEMSMAKIRDIIVPCLSEAIEFIPLIKAYWKEEISLFDQCQIEFFKDFLVSMSDITPRNLHLPLRESFDNRFSNALSMMAQKLAGSCNVEDTLIGLLQTGKKDEICREICEKRLENEEKLVIGSNSRVESLQSEFRLKKDSGSLSWASLKNSILALSREQDQHLINQEIEALKKEIETERQIKAIYGNFKDLVNQRELLFNGNLDQKHLVKGKTLSQFIDSWHSQQVAREFASRSRINP